MANTIGNFDFINLRGVPGTYAAEIERLVRPNVDGQDFRHLGKRGRPFSLISVRDTATLAAARTLLRNYLAAIGGDPLALVWNDIDFQTSESLWVKILGVTPVVMETRETICGGLEAGTPTGWLEAQWDLVFIEIQP